MATYVTSDAHGHLRALDAALTLAGPGAQDTVVVMGDMIDRGPDPVGVMRLVRSLPGARVLMGNHERMMLGALLTDDASLQGGWDINGGWVTAGQLDALPRAEAADLVDWVAGLPLFDIVSVPDAFSAARGPHASAQIPRRRIYLLAHAGIDALAARGYLATAGVPVEEPGALSGLGVGELRPMMEAQDAEDLLWIRERFWGAPTGFVDARGIGPIVVAGHTPSVLLGSFAQLMGGPVLDGHGRARVVEVGACQDTGGVADRIDIDASAAGGFPHGQVAVMRLEDHRVWYAPIAEGE
ncbi:MAG: metallophosphoesterase [Collinsella sp.]|nr:metallophosphoesterase [Collinsella sp.]